MNHDTKQTSSQGGKAKSYVIGQKEGSRKAARNHDGVDAVSKTGGTEGAGAELKRGGGVQSQLDPQRKTNVLEKRRLAQGLRQGEKKSRGGKGSTQLKLFFLGKTVCHQGGG